MALDGIVSREDSQWIVKLASWQYHKGSLEDIIYALLLDEVGRRDGGNVVGREFGTGVARGSVSA
jgi:hypothetical protein